MRCPIPSNKICWETRSFKFPQVAGTFDWTSLFSAQEMRSGFWHFFSKPIFLFKSSTVRVELIWHNCMHPLYRCLHLRLLPWLPFIVDGGALRAQFIWVQKSILGKMNCTLAGLGFLTDGKGCLGLLAQMQLYPLCISHIRRGVLQDGLY